ncbi:hypothetical protein [Flavobacterium sp. C3NV]|uniref:hypothetical protein n=1 Tax=Flavobacterium sp. C3NV TaxID=3393358 RepID=UPI00398FB318
MATFSQTNIKCKNVETVLAELKKYLPTGREIWLDTRKEWFYNLPHDENLSEEKNITLVISKNLSKDWVEVEFDFQGNLYLYDEILRRISKNLETDILLAYYQSTSGDGRLAKFKNGQLELSFYEKSFYYKFHSDDSPPIDRLYLADNFGVMNSNIEMIKNAKVGEDSGLIEYDLINEFYKSGGWVPDLHGDFSNEDYLHVEQLK